MRFFITDARKVRKDGTISYEGQWLEVPYELVGKTVVLVVSPHDKKVVRVESTSGEYLGTVVPLDPIANLNRARARPKEKSDEGVEMRKAFNMVELALENYENSLKLMQPLRSTENETTTFWFNTYSTWQERENTMG